MAGKKYASTADSRCLWVCWNSLFCWFVGVVCWSCVVHSCFFLLLIDVFFYNTTNTEFNTGVKLPRVVLSIQATWVMFKSMAIKTIVWLWKQKCQIVLDQLQCMPLRHIFCATVLWKKSVADQIHPRVQLWQVWFKAVFKHFNRWLEMQSWKIYWKGQAIKMYILIQVTPTKTIWMEPPEKQSFLLFRTAKLLWSLIRTCRIELIIYKKYLFWT